MAGRSVDDADSTALVSGSAGFCGTGGGAVCPASGLAGRIHVSEQQGIISAGPVAGAYNRREIDSVGAETVILLVDRKAAALNDVVIDDVRLEQ